jgi:hypothetical protein
MRINKAQGQTIWIVDAYLIQDRYSLMANSTLHCPEPPQRATPPSSHEAQGEGLDQDFEEAKMTNLKKNHL